MLNTLFLLFYISTSTRSWKQTCSASVGSTNLFLKRDCRESLLSSLSTTCTSFLSREMIAEDFLCLRSGLIHFKLVNNDPSLLLMLDMNLFHTKMSVLLGTEEGHHNKLA